MRVVVLFPAAGSFDIMSRLLAQRMQLGQTVLIENRSGGGWRAIRLYPMYLLAEKWAILRSKRRTGAASWFRRDAGECRCTTQCGNREGAHAPVVRENLRTQGLISAPSTLEQFAALIKSDGARYGNIARAANVRLD
jgi:hypothetical protein